jgi:hypothetical protein
MAVETFDYIAFVDIDGVFNYMDMECSFGFIQESVDVINKLYEEYGIKLVLSSSWREAYTFEFMKDLFQNNGVKAPLIDRTYFNVTPQKEKDFSLGEIECLDDEDDVYKPSTRDNEIYEWVKRFKPKHFIIFDDFKMHGVLKKYQCVTSYWGEDESLLGLRMMHLDECREILELDNDLV